MVELQLYQFESSPYSRWWSTENIGSILFFLMLGFWVRIYIQKRRHWLNHSFMGVIRCYSYLVEIFQWFHREPRALCGFCQFSIYKVICETSLLGVDDAYIPLDACSWLNTVLNFWPIKFSGGDKPFGQLLGSVLNDKLGQKFQESLRILCILLWIRTCL